MKELLVRLGVYLIRKFGGKDCEYHWFEKGVFIVTGNESYLREYYKKISIGKMRELGMVIPEDLDTKTIVIPNILCQHEPIWINSTVGYWQCKKCFTRVHDIAPKPINVPTMPYVPPFKTEDLGEDIGDFVKMVWLIEKLRRDKFTMNDLIQKVKLNFEFKIFEIKK